ncbi:MAG: DUF47 family protein [Candidatus Micrarchaeota archaeon]|nr:DUF47 family protein [Candidatus Micrarchaeota archaeon]
MGFMRPLFPVSKQEKIFHELSVFLDKVTKSVLEFSASLERFCKTGKTDVSVVDRLESEADESRRKLERMIFSDFVGEKENFIELIEKIDDVADNAEIASWDLDIPGFTIPGEVKKSFLELSAALREISEALKKSVGSLAFDVRKVLTHASEVKEKRDELRKKVHRLRHQIFRIREAKRVFLLSNLAYRIMKIADSAEEASDRASVFVAKVA